MRSLSLISKAGAAIALLSLLFLPFIGCNEMEYTGIDIIKNNELNRNIKLFIVLSIAFAVIIIFINKHLPNIIFSIIGIISLIAAYFVAHKENEYFEIKTGAYLSIIGYIITLIVNIFGLSQKKSEEEKKDESTKEIKE